MPVHYSEAERRAAGALDSVNERVKHLSAVSRGTVNDTYDDLEGSELWQLLRDGIELRGEIHRNKRAREYFEERLAKDDFEALCDRYSTLVARHDERGFSFHCVP